MLKDQVLNSPKTQWRSRSLLLHSFHYSLSSHPLLPLSLHLCLLASCLFPPILLPLHQNVVVVNSQPAVAPVIITHQPHVPDYLTLTIVGFILCFFCGGVVGMLLLIPALICSVMVSIVSCCIPLVQLCQIVFLGLEDIL